MKLQAKKPKTTAKPEIATSPNKRLQEIAKILINGICRLEAKEKSQIEYSRKIPKNLPKPQFST